RNIGTIAWLAKGRGRVALSYKWLNQESGAAQTGPLVTNLPHDVQPGEAVELSADFQTPKRPGKYLLIFDLFVGHFGWFSNADVIPAVIEADIQPGTTRSVEQAPASRPMPEAGAESVPRSGLWSAAVKMFLAHPLG